MNDNAHEASQPLSAAPPAGGGKTAAWVLATWLAAHVLLVAGHVLLVLLYSIAIEPGLEHADYQAFAQRSGPWFSILFGGPVFYAVGWVLKRKVHQRARAAGLAAWALYSATDATILLASLGTVPPLLAGQWVVSQGIKLLAVVLGARAARGLR